LLRLEQVEKVRTSLQRVANDTKKEATRAETDDARAKQDFFQHLGIKAPKKADLLAAVNERRTLLKLDPLADLTAELSIKAGVVADGSKGPAKPRLSKAAALGDLTAYGERVAEAKGSAIKKAASTGLAILINLTENPVLLTSIKQKLLVEQGLGLIDEDSCPLCDNAWDINDLRAHLKEKLAKATEATTLWRALRARSSRLLKFLRALALSRINSCRPAPTPTLPLTQACCANSS